VWFKWWGFRSKNVHFMSVVPVLDLLEILQPKSIVTYNLLPLLDSLKNILSFIITKLNLITVI